MKRYFSIANFVLNYHRKCSINLLSDNLKAEKNSFDLTIVWLNILMLALCQFVWFRWKKRFYICRANKNASAMIVTTNTATYTSSMRFQKNIHISCIDCFNFSFMCWKHQISVSNAIEMKMTKKNSYSNALNSDCGGVSTGWH